MNEELKWLAENVHEWPGMNRHKVKRANNAIGYICITMNSDGGYTRSQWQAARDELSGKPSWDDAPEWAEWIAQSPRGHWECFEKKPFSDECAWRHAPHRGECVDFGRFTGEVLGDWRNTLERRQMSVSQAFEKMRQIGGFDVEKSLAYTNCDAPTEWRGPEDGLPPVGLVCESHLIGSDWEVGRIAYIGRNVLVWESDCGHEYATRPNDRWFRPIPTEEDKAVEEMVDARKAHPWSDEQFCRELYRLGYRKQESK